MKGRFSSQCRRSLKCTRRFENGLAVAEVFRIGVAVTEIVVNENCGLPCEFNALAAFVAGDEVVEAHHVGGRFSELGAVFGAGAAGQFPFLGANFPADRSGKFVMATGANQFLLLVLFPFRVKRAIIHD